jgi:hypothetical protein
MPKKTSASVAERLPVPIELIERRIYLIRGQKVMLDSELADLYQVTTGNLNLAVRRNAQRFPEDVGKCRMHPKHVRWIAGSPDRDGITCFVLGDHKVIVIERRSRPTIHTRPAPSGSAIWTACSIHIDRYKNKCKNGPQQCVVHEKIGK